MATPFENFVNAELPKRIGTNEDPTSVSAGKVPVTTGIGLLVEFRDYIAGTGTNLEIVDIINSFIVTNEVPERSPIDGDIFVVDYQYIPHSLCVYHNGIRLAENRDFIPYNEYSFQLLYTDIEVEDNIIVDYKRVGI